MLLISDKKSHKNISYFKPNNDIIPTQKLSNFSTKTGTNNTKSNSNKNDKKIENPLEFIKQKKKFIIHNLFDKNGTKDFLESKEKAMMEIKLDDEIIVNDKKKDKKLFNPALSAISKKININKEIKKSKSRKRRSVDFASDHFKQKKPDTLIQKSNLKMKKNDNPKKLSSIYKSAKISRNNSIESNDSNKCKDNILIIDRKSSDSKDSNYLYKFIIDNANEPDEQFYKKLDKMKKERKDKKIRSEISNSNLGKKDKEVKRFNSDKNWRYKNKNNIFMFSEKAKNLMKNDSSLEISSIIMKKESEIKSPKKYQSMKNSNAKSSGIKDKKSSLIFGEEEINFINDNKRDSVLQILDDLK
jgi:hypothetical protein